MLTALFFIIFVLFAGGVVMFGVARFVEGAKKKKEEKKN